MAKYPRLPDRDSGNSPTCFMRQFVPNEKSDFWLSD